MSSLLTAKRLARCRAMVAQHLPSTATVQTNAPVDDDQGGMVDAWTSGASLPCKVLQKPKDTSERREGDAEQSEVFWEVQFAHGVTLNAKQRLVVDSETYEILDDNGGQSNALHLVVTCRKLN